MNENIQERIVELLFVALMIAIAFYEFGNAAFWVIGAVVLILKVTYDAGMKKIEPDKKAR